jgi:hypothetical protein
MSMKTDWGGSRGLGSVSDSVKRGRRRMERVQVGEEARDEKSIKGDGIDGSCRGG